MKKIAYIARNLNVNGISSVILNYCKHLDCCKYIIDIYVGNPIAKENVEKISDLKNVHIIKTPSKRGKNPFKYFSFLKNKLKGYDVVHVNGNSRTITLELLISKLNKNKLVIAHCHSTSTDFKLFHYILKPLFNHLYDCGIACSSKAGKWMFGKKKFFVITNGLEIEKYFFNNEYRKNIRKKLNISSNCKIIGHVGNFSDVKNYPFIVDVFDRICSEHENFYLLLIGKYQNNPLLENKIRNSKNNNKIILLGPTNEIYKYYNAMDCFIFPSKYEGLGIVALEAQINNLYCLVSTNVPMDVKITDNISFLDTKNEDIRTWCDIIIKKCNLKRNSFKDDFILYKNNCNIKNCIKKIEKIYLDGSVENE